MRLSSCGAPFRRPSTRGARRAPEGTGAPVHAAGSHGSTGSTSRTKSKHMLVLDAKPCHGLIFLFALRQSRPAHRSTRRIRSTNWLLQEVWCQPLKAFALCTTILFTQSACSNVQKAFVNCRTLYSIVIAVMSRSRIASKPAMRLLMTPMCVAADMLLTRCRRFQSLEGMLASSR